MLLENLKITINSKLFTLPNKKKKGDKGSYNMEKIGSFEMDYCITTEALSKLINVIEEDLFEHDGVELQISATSSNY
tara:strand:- start:1849 stop:2079 length:231 start_codon:yes stop_codon:yes gene_type:complete